MDILLQILGLAALIGGIAPVAMAGGQMIASFMMGKHIVAWVGITVGTMLALVLGGVLALQWIMPFLSLSNAMGPVSALTMVLPPWAVFLLGKRWMEGKAKL
jgi:hypothetical protein